MSITQQEPTQVDPARYAEKISKLLAKAESTTPEEAELLVAKAQELMTAYAIDEAMIDAARGSERRERIIEKLIKFTGTYSVATAGIAETIARATRCRNLQSRYNNRYTVYVIGFESDVNRVEMLNASLQIQCARALATWWKTFDGKSWMDSAARFRARREFIFGFASGLGSKLEAANLAARETDAEARARAEDISSTEASDSVALVLRSREDQIGDWVDEKYGKLRTGRSGSYYSGSHSARTAGSAAGRSASTGTGGLRTPGALAR